MKKLLLSAFFGMLAYAGSAQDFMVEVGSFEETTLGMPGVEPENEAITFHDYVKNLTNGTLSGVKWRIFQANFPSSGWYIWGFCDNAYCRGTQAVAAHIADPNAFEEFLPIPEGEKASIYPYVFVSDTAANGTGTIKVRVYNDNQSDTIVYVVHKTNTSVNTIKVTDSRVSVYPNPSSNQNVNIFVNQELKAKQVIVYNIFGAQVARMPVNSEVVALNNATLAAGNYLIKVIGDNNEVITTRKWTKK